MPYIFISKFRTINIQQIHDNLFKFLFWMFLIQIFVRPLMVDARLVFTKLSTADEKLFCQSWDLKERNQQKSLNVQLWKKFHDIAH